MMLYTKFAKCRFLAEGHAYSTSCLSVTDMLSVSHGCIVANW